MSDSVMIWSNAYSRRHLLLRAAPVVAAATAIVWRSAEAALKISESAVGYQDHPNGDKHCGACAQFLPPNSCKLVEGTISPNGYCRIFSPRQSASTARSGPTSAG